MELVESGTTKSWSEERARLEARNAELEALVVELGADEIPEDEQLAALKKELADMAVNAFNAHKRLAEAVARNQSFIDRANAAEKERDLALVRAETAEGQLKKLVALAPPKEHL